MDANQAKNSLTDLFTNPSQIFSIVSNPGRAGMDFFKSLSSKDKQYVAYAAGAGLIIYGIILGRQGK